MQDVACFKIDEQKAGARIDEEIAERVEVEIAGKIRDRQLTIVVYPDKSGFAASVRSIDLPDVTAVDIGCDEKGVGGRNDGTGLLGQFAGFRDRRRLGLVRLTRKAVITQLDILRAVAKGLADRNFQGTVCGALDVSVHPVATPGVQFDAEHADGPAGLCAGGGGIGSIKRSADGQRLG